MKKVLSLLGVITLLELWALYIFRTHPLVRPEWFTTLLLVIQLLMGLGGIQACRWLLRSSPVSKLDGPQRDWTKLWLWCGPLGGLLLVGACAFGKLVAFYFNSLLIGWMATAHIAGGAVVWTIALPWTLNEMLSDPTTGFRERVLMQLGIATHILGFAAYLGFFPGSELKPVSLLAAVYFFGSIVYYLMAVAICWSVTFRFWKPRVLTPEEQEANLEVYADKDLVENED
jgi:hypothetical protein